jgi:hypothetical protein
MTKRQVIDEIVAINNSAPPAFLARFSEAELEAYLRHLHLARTPRLSGSWRQYGAYSQESPPAPVRNVQPQYVHEPPAEADAATAPAATENADAYEPAEPADPAPQVKEEPQTRPAQPVQTPLFRQPVKEDEPLAALTDDDPPEDDIPAAEPDDCDAVPEPQEPPEADDFSAPDETPHEEQPEEELAAVTAQTDAAGDSSYNQGKEESETVLF